MWILPGGHDVEISNVNIFSLKETHTHTNPAQNQPTAASSFPPPPGTFREHSAHAGKPCTVTKSPSITGPLPTLKYLLISVVFPLSVPSFLVRLAISPEPKRPSPRALHHSVRQPPKPPPRHQHQPSTPISFPVIPLFFPSSPGFCPITPNPNNGFFTEHDVK